MGFLAGNDRRVECKQQAEERQALNHLGFPWNNLRIVCCCRMTLKTVKKILQVFQKFPTTGVKAILTSIIAKLSPYLQPEPGRWNSDFSLISWERTQMEPTASLDVGGGTVKKSILSFLLALISSRPFCNLNPLCTHFFISLSSYLG